MKAGKGSLKSSLFLTLADKALLGITVGLILVFILYPILAVMLQSVQIDGEWNLLYYRTLFTDHGGLLRNSLKVSVSVTLLSALFSVMVAITGAFASRTVSRILTPVLLFTMISPPFVTSIAYISLFGKRGWITHGLLGLNLNPYGFEGIVAMQTLGFISLNALMLIGVIRGMDRTVLLSARDVGATTNAILKDMVLPLMMPGIAVVLMLTFVRSLADFSTPAIIGGAYSVLATEAYLNVVAYGNITRAAAMNVLLFLPSLVAFVFYRRYLQNADITGTRAMSEGELQLDKSGLLYRLCGAVTVFFVMALVLQYGSIIVTAFTKMRFGQMYWTLDNLKETLPYISDTFVRSIVYSLICGIFGSLLGFLLSYYLVIRKHHWLGAVDFIGTLPYIIPGTFFGLGYIFAFRSPPLQLVGTAAIVILNVVFRQLPFSTKVAQSSMVAIGRDVVQAGSDVGAHPLHVLKDIVLPLSRSGFLVSFFNNFSQTMTTVGSIIFLVYPGQKLATLVMFDVLRSGKNRVGAMIAVLLMLIVVGVNLLFMALMQRRTHVSAD